MKFSWEVLTKFGVGLFFVVEVFRLDCLGGERVDFRFEFFMKMLLLEVWSWVRGELWEGRM